MKISEKAIFDELGILKQEFEMFSERKYLSLIELVR